MRFLLLAGIALLAATSATSAKADIITITGNAIGPNHNENFASMIYQFAPLTVPGTVTVLTVTYVGSVVPGDYITGLNTVSDITLTPYAQIDNVFGPVAGIGYSNFYILPPTTAAAGAPQTIPANRFNGNVVMGFIGSPITVSANAPVVPDNIAALASGPILLAVDGYAPISGSTYIPKTVGNLQVLGDESYVNTGRLTLAITYDPATSVPEPISIAVLGAGVLGVLGLRRRG